MKFLMVTTDLEGKEPSMPSPEMDGAIMQLIEQETRAGVLVMTGGILPVSMGGARVRAEGGTMTVIDGPFTEAKEMIAGFAIVEVNSLDEALEVSRRFYAVVGEGQGEIRQLIGPDDPLPIQ